MKGPPDLLAWRDEFPAVGRGVFLGSHTLAPASRRTRAAIERFMDSWETKASAERVWFDDIIPEMRRLEAMAAGIIGADAGDVALTHSVTTGIASIASALDFGADRRDVVLSRREFPTDSLGWLAHEARGARIVWTDGSDAHDYIAAIGDATAAVSASRVSYLDGTITDVAAVCTAARAAGALSVIDDFHGAGIVPVDVSALGCDVMVFGPYKYLLGSSNIGILYVRPDAAARLRPSITGWFAQRDFFAFDGSRIDWPDTAQRFTMGTPAALSIFASAAGMSIVTEVGVDRIRERSLELTEYVIERADAAGLAVRTPRDPARRGGLVAVEVPDSKKVLDELLDRGVIVDERHGALRVCPHFFNSEDDIDALFAALQALGVMS